MTDELPAPLINPALALKPVWIDEPYIKGDKPEAYRARWVAVSLDKAIDLASRCERMSGNRQGATFGYKGKYFISGRELPRNVLCINAARTEAWVDLGAFPQ